MGRERARSIEIESNVRQLRAQRGWTLTMLAGLAGTSEARMRRIERGDVLGVQLRALMRVAVALDVTVAECWPSLGPRSTKRPGAREWTRDAVERIEARMPAESLTN